VLAVGAVRRDEGTAKPKDPDNSELQLCGSDHETPWRPAVPCRGDGCGLRTGDCLRHGYLLHKPLFVLGVSGRGGNFVAVALTAIVLAWEQISASARPSILESTNRR
jgi:hypothetical protein